MSWASRRTVSTAATLVGLGAGVVAFGFLLQAIAVVTAVPTSTIPQGDVSSARSSWVQYVGVVGLFIGFIYTAMSYRLTRQARTTDALIAAVGNIGDTESQVRRVGGVYALGVLVAQDPSIRDDIEHFLGAFVRNQTRHGSAQSHTEVLDALSLIAKRSQGERLSAKRLDLRGVHLEGVRLFGAHLENCDLRGAHMERVDFTDARLTASLLSGANLDGAVLRGCHLTDAQLTDCSVIGTDFYGATTSGIDVSGTDMSEALNYNTT